MININRNNYEEFFIDYIDGNLNHHEVAELMIFLSDNPDLDTELNEMKEFVTVEKTEKFPHKLNLKKDEKSLSGNVIDDICIAKIEGDLNLNELQDLDSKLDNNLELQFNYFKLEKTKLKKDSSIVFLNKEDLKQSINVISIKKYYRYAAVLIPAVIISVLLLTPKNNTQLDKNIYVANNTVNKKVVEESNDNITDNKVFKIVKKETPSIVSKSIHTIEINKKEQPDNNKKIENAYKVNNPSVFIDPVNKFIDERKKLAGLAYETKENKNNKNENEISNPYFNTYDFTSNEIKSDEYIRKQMEQFKLNDKPQAKEPLSFGESIAETFANLSSVLHFDKEKVDDGEIYRLAFNSKRFEIGRIKKKKD